jgi:uncharacterized protein
MNEVRYNELPEVRAYQEEGSPDLILEGYAALFNVRSKVLYEDGKFFEEELVPGAFSRALADSPDTIFVRNHNSDEVQARASNGTLQLREDEKGLWFRATLNSDTSFARDTHAMVKRGDIGAMSFAFTVSKEGQEWLRQEGGMYLRKVTSVRKLFDVSAVTRAAYPSTAVTARDLPVEAPALKKPDWRVDHVKFLKEIKLKPRA